VCAVVRGCCMLVTCHAISSALAWVGREKSLVDAEMAFKTQTDAMRADVSQSLWKER
jgi:hypothetical protein